MKSCNKNAARTDLAVEFAPSKSKKIAERISVVEVNVDKTLSEKLSRPVGRYCTLETDIVTSGDKDEFSRLSSSLSDILKSFLGKTKSVMIAALGNPDLTADSLGARVFRLVNMTRHLDLSPSVCGVAPNVMGMTGIESFDIIKAVCDSVSPDAVLVIDSLTASSSDRIGRVFQVTDVGITPGSGVCNHRRRLDSSTLNRPVISLGVPLVVFSSTLVNERFGTEEDGGIIVTPKDIDLIVRNAAYVAANAINQCFGGL